MANQNEALSTCIASMSGVAPVESCAFISLPPCINARKQVSTPEHSSDNTKYYDSSAVQVATMLQASLDHSSITRERHARIHRHSPFFTAHISAVCWVCVVVILARAGSVLRQSCVADANEMLIKW